MLISHTIKEKTWRENGYYDYIGRRARRASNAQVKSNKMYKKGGCCTCKEWICWIADKDKWNKHIEKDFCICYNANRQKEVTSPFGRKNESPDRVAAQFGDSSCLLYQQSTW